MASPGARQESSPFVERFVSPILYFREEYKPMLDFSSFIAAQQKTTDIAKAVKALIQTFALEIQSIGSRSDDSSTQAELDSLTTQMLATNKELTDATLVGTTALLPVISSFSPISAQVGGVVVISGMNFTGATTVSVGGVSAPTFTVDSPQQITATVPVGDTTGLINVNTPQGTASSSQPFTVLAGGTNGNAGVPAILTIAPTTLAAGGVGFTLTVNGTGFTPSSTVQFDANNRSTTFVSPTQLTATITAADVATSGGQAVTVVNPDPNAATSNIVNFAVV